jgi:hypothetical protein
LHDEEPQDEGCGCDVCGVVEDVAEDRVEV